MKRKGPHLKVSEMWSVAHLTRQEISASNCVIYMYLVLMRVGKRPAVGQLVVVNCHMLGRYEIPGATCLTGWAIKVVLTA